jgi:uncharacterized protein
MRWYIDASIALHAMLPTGDRQAREWLDAVAQTRDEVFSSTLLQLELARVVRREQLPLSILRPLLERVNLVSIDDSILFAAAAIEPHVKSLDAIHLASCALLGVDVTVATHDANMALVASQLGFVTFDPLQRLTAL